MILAIGEIQVDIEAAIVVPGCRGPVASAIRFKCPRIGRARSPTPAGLIRDRQRRGY